MTQGHSSPELCRTGQIGEDFHGRGEPIEEVSISATSASPFPRIWTLTQLKPRTGCGTYGSSREAISSGVSRSESAATASSR
jgi:hypothetical protein